MQLGPWNCQVFPLTFHTGRQVVFEVAPKAPFKFEHACYQVVVRRVDLGSGPKGAPALSDISQIVQTQADGLLRITYQCEAECEHYVRIYHREDSSCSHLLAQASIYSLHADLASLLPLRGDLHLHSNRSDGKDDPTTVCINYRKLGYDFLALTDHGRYYPSLEAIRAFAPSGCGLNILPGEEIELPGTNAHLVHVGGAFSVNGLLKDLPNFMESNGALDARRLDEHSTAPAALTMTAYQQAIDLVEARLADCPPSVDKRSFAVCVWAFDMIRKAGGCGIFAHPFWLQDVWHLSEAFTRHMLEQHPFDAFEVLGGEAYYQQNGLQTALYYDEYRHGRVHPVVGSSDSHDSSPGNPHRAICSTLVFAPENTRAGIVSAIKKGYSVAIDTLSLEYRLVGAYRFQKYAAFLMDHYFPLHDPLAAADAEWMQAYLERQEGIEKLTEQHKAMQKLWRRCFARA